MSELEVERRDVHLDRLGRALLVADLRAAPQAAPAVELAKVGELRAPLLGAERELPAVQTGKGGAQARGERGHRLEGDQCARGARRARPRDRTCPRFVPASTYVGSPRRDAARTARIATSSRCAAVACEGRPPRAAPAVRGAVRAPRRRDAGRSSPVLPAFGREGSHPRAQQREHELPRSLYDLCQAGGARRARACLRRRPFRI